MIIFLSNLFIGYNVSGDFMKPYWIVGVSGGVDSMALLHQLVEAKRTLVVVHVNYQQRRSADRDQRIVEEFCTKHKIPLVVFDGSNLGTGNFQDLARDFRYQAFFEVYQAYQAQRLVLAHHLDDQYETILFQLLTNRRPRYLGMKRFTKIKDMLVYRPLLNTSKQELIDYAQQHQLAYGFDESNLDLKYTRNQIRAALEHISDADKELLLTYQKHYRKQRKQQERRIHKLMKQGDTRIELERYQRLETSTRLLLLRKLVENFVDVHSFSFRYFKDLDDKLHKAIGFDQNLDETYSIRLEYGIISIIDSKLTQFEYVFDKIEWVETPYFQLKPEGKTIEGLTLDNDDFPITIRSPKPADEIKMRFGTKKVNRFFIDRKIEKQQRKLWPVVENAKNEVIFVAEFGCDINHYSTKPTIYVVK